MMNTEQNENSNFKTHFKGMCVLKLSLRSTETQKYLLGQYKILSPAIYFSFIHPEGNNTQKMNIHEIEAQIDKNFEKTGNTSRFERFLAKKYKCLIIFIMSILSISEMIYLILQKNSSTLVSDVVAKYFNVTNKKIQ